MLMSNSDECISIRNVANLASNTVILNFLLLSNVKNYVAFLKSPHWIHFAAVVTFLESLF